MITEVEGMRVYETDGLAAYRGLPSVVVLPETTDQVSAVLKVCGELGSPVVARGAGTGSVGWRSALSRQSVLLSLWPASTASSPSIPMRAPPACNRA